MTAINKNLSGAKLKPISRYIIRGSTIVWLYAALTPLCSAADTDNQFNLPQLYSPQAGQEQEQDQGVIKDSEEVLKLLDDEFKYYVHKYTRKQLTRDSTISIQRHGLRLETQYLFGDMTTEVEAEDNGDVLFKLKISF